MEHTKCFNGEVFYNILYYRREQEIEQENEWTKRLTKHGRRCLKQLLGHARFRRAFEDLLDIPGLWRNVGMGTLHKMISMRCDEELLCYLGLVKDVWERIVQDGPARRKVDPETVGRVELRCPKFSTLDEEEMRDGMVKGEIFGSFNREERAVIWEELRSIGCLIPSLATFFRDLNYLQACADGIKHLIPLPRGDMTVRKTLEASFSKEKLHGELYAVEITEDKPCNKHVPVPDRLEHGYRQLWLKAMRNVRTMAPRLAKKEEDLLAKAQPQEADEDLLSRSAVLADLWGFQTAQIASLKERSSNKATADVVTIEAGTDQHHLRRASTPALVSHDPKAPGHRCGFPDNRAHNRDRAFLFIENMQQEPEARGRAVTSFFVRRSVYLAIFEGSAAQSTASRREPPSMGRDQVAEDRGPREHGRVAGIPAQNMPETGELQDASSRKAGERGGLEQEQQKTTEEQVRWQELQRLSESQRQKARRLSRLERERSGWAEGDSEPVRRANRSIRFMVRENGTWKTAHIASRSRPSEVEAAAMAFMDSRFRPYSVNMTPLLPSECFGAAMSSGAGMILLVPENDINITEELRESVSRLTLEDVDEAA